MIIILDKNKENIYGFVLMFIAIACFVNMAFTIWMFAKMNDVVNTMLENQNSVSESIVEDEESESMITSSEQIVESSKEPNSESNTSEDILEDTSKPNSESNTSEDTSESTSESTSETTIENSEPIESEIENETQPLVSESDVELLATIIYQEAGGDAACDDCRRRIADIVLNRVESDLFPNTIYEVLTQPGQYGYSSATGVVWPDRAANPVETHAVERARRIAREVLEGQHSDLYGNGYIWQAGFEQGTGGFWHCVIYFGRGSIYLQED